MLLEEYAGADLTKRQFKVLLAVLRLTYGWNKPMDRIANSQIAQIARLPEKRVSEARVQLVGMNLLTQVGRSIGPNKNTAEWLLPVGESCDTENPSNQGIPQNEGKSPKSGEEESLNLGEHQRHINTLNTNTPQPQRGSVSGRKKNLSQRKTRSTTRRYCLHTTPPWETAFPRQRH
nr:replication protein [Trabulsiella guamensis]